MTPELLCRVHEVCTGFSRATGRSLKIQDGPPRVVLGAFVRELRGLGISAELDRSMDMAALVEFSPPDEPGITALWRAIFSQGEGFTKIKIVSYRPGDWGSNAVLKRAAKILGK